MVILKSCYNVIQDERRQKIDFITISNSFVHLGLTEKRILKFRTKVVKMSGTATVDDQLVAEAELMITFGDVK